MRSELFQGRYLFHLHTLYTDGKLEVEDHFRNARDHKIERLIFLEHIRREPSFDVLEYVAEVKECSTRYEVPAHIGFEAKVLPDGEIDILPEHFALAEVIGIAEHGFPKDSDPDTHKAALYKAIDSCRGRDDKTFVWVHPGLWLYKKSLLVEKESVYLEMLAYAAEAGLRIERNLRYNLIPERHLKAVPASRLVVGADAHTAAELARGTQCIS